GTRREELLLDPAVLNRVWTLRRMIDTIGGLESVELIIDRLNRTKSNAEFLATLNKDI
ncbi:MAG: transcription termination factor Rho, partial [Chloroflexi bacterium]|nr:transcription termination factor Rho [Chloroflexota bacterium]